MFNLEHFYCSLFCSFYFPVLAILYCTKLNCVSSMSLQISIKTCLTTYLLVDMAILNILGYNAYMTHDIGCGITGNQRTTAKMVHSISTHRCHCHHALKWFILCFPVKSKFSRFLEKSSWSSLSTFYEQIEWKH